MEKQKVSAMRKSSTSRRLFRRRKSWNAFQANLTDRQFRRYFCMSRECFVYICNMIEGKPNGWQCALMCFAWEGGCRRLMVDTRRAEILCFVKRVTKSQAQLTRVIMTLGIMCPKSAHHIPTFLSARALFEHFFGGKKCWERSAQKVLINMTDRKPVNTMSVLHKNMTVHMTVDSTISSVCTVKGNIKTKIAQKCQGTSPKYVPR